MRFTIICNGGMLTVLKTKPTERLTEVYIFVHWHEKIVFEENVADYTEHVDEDQSEYGGENN